MFNLQTVLKLNTCQELQPQSGAKSFTLLDVPSTTFNKDNPIKTV